MARVQYAGIKMAGLLLKFLVIFGFIQDEVNKTQDKFLISFRPQGFHPFWAIADFSIYNENSCWQTIIS